MEEVIAVQKTSAFPKEKFEKKEWHERLGKDFWQLFYRSALAMELLDRRLAQKNTSVCGDYRSQKDVLAQGLALVATLDRDDLLFLPRKVSLAALYRGVTVEQFVGQWLGNLLDPGKGRLESGNIGAEAFYLVPRVGTDKQWISHAVGIALAMRLQNHPKLVSIPLFRKDLLSSDVQRLLRFAASYPIPVAFIVLDGSGEVFARAAGLKERAIADEDFLSVLKVLKGQLDRVRSRKEPIVLSFTDPSWQNHSVTEILGEFLISKDWSPDESLLQQVQREVDYGIERATMIPSPPKATVIQDVTRTLRPDLERQWLEWGKAHGK